MHRSTKLDEESRYVVRFRFFHEAAHERGITDLVELLLGNISQQIPLGNVDKPTLIACLPPISPKRLQTVADEQTAAIIVRQGNYFRADCLCEIAGINPRPLSHQSPEVESLQCHRRFPPGAYAARLASGRASYLPLIA